jgi:hypothetical protein
MLGKLCASLLGTLYTSLLGTLSASLLGTLSATLCARRSRAEPTSSARRGDFSRVRDRDSKSAAGTRQGLRVGGRD